MKQRVVIYSIFFLLSLVNTLSAQSAREVLFINDNVNYVTDTLIKKITIPSKDLKWSRLFNYGGKIYIPYMYRNLDGGMILANHISTSNIKKWVINDKAFEIDEHTDDNICFVHSIFGRYSFPHYIFYGNKNIDFNCQQNFDSEWSESEISLSTTLNEDFKAVGCVCDNSSNRQTIIYNSKDTNGENHIFSISSYDNGRNWGSSSIAVKHNIKELVCWDIASDTKNDNYCFMVLSDKRGHTYYSTSEDKGLSWSYPSVLPIAMNGSEYKLLIEKGHFILLFKVITDDGKGDNNDIFIWRGGSKLNREKYLGRYNKLIDNNHSIKLVDKCVVDIVLKDRKSFYLLLKEEIKEGCNLELHSISDIKYAKKQNKQTKKKLTK